MHVGDSDGFGIGGTYVSSSSGGGWFGATGCFRVFGNGFGSAAGLTAFELGLSAYLPSRVTNVDMTNAKKGTVR